MTKRQHRIFVFSGIAFLSATVVTMYVDSLRMEAPGEFPIGKETLFNMLGFFWLGSFILLMWLGLMPRAFTYLFLRDIYGVQQDYKQNKRIIQKILLITDDPRVQKVMNSTISEENLTRR